MATLTTQYMEYVEKMKQIKLELAADYLLMSAMLIEIKSRMLLPPIINDEDDDLDPRAELVKKLIEYELMKTASQELDDISQVGRDRFIAQGYFEKVIEPKSLPDVSIEELFNAWKNVIKRAEQFETHRINRAELSVREHMSLIIKKLGKDQLISFDSFFNEDKLPWPGFFIGQELNNNYKLLSYEVLNNIYFCKISGIEMSVPYNSNFFIFENDNLTLLDSSLTI